MPLLWENFASGQTIDIEFVYAENEYIEVEKTSKSARVRVAGLGPVGFNF
jgi:hypothetical protein